MCREFTLCVIVLAPPPICCVTLYQLFSHSEFCQRDIMLIPVPPPLCVVLRTRKGTEVKEQALL